MPLFLMGTMFVEEKSRNRGLGNYVHSFEQI